MSITTLPVSEAKQRFTELVTSAERVYDRYLITRNGKEAAVVMSAEEYGSLLESLDILAHRKEVRAITEALDDAGRGRIVSMEKYLSRKRKNSGRRAHRR